MEGEGRNRSHHKHEVLKNQVRRMEGIEGDIEDYVTGNLETHA